MGALAASFSPYRMRSTLTPMTALLKGIFRFWRRVTELQYEPLKDAGVVRNSLSST